jgi:hypothetical protein
MPAGHYSAAENVSSHEQNYYRRETLDKDGVIEPFLGASVRIKQNRAINARRFRSDVRREMRQPSTRATLMFDGVFYPIGSLPATSCPPMPRASPAGTHSPTGSAPIPRASPAGTRSPRGATPTRSAPIPRTAPTRTPTRRTPKAGTSKTRSPVHPRTPDHSRTPDRRTPVDWTTPISWPPIIYDGRRWQRPLDVSAPIPVIPTQIGGGCHTRSTSACEDRHCKRANE